MIEQMVFRNFKSYRDETVLSFVPVDVSDHLDTLLQRTDGYEFLPVVVLYGPNGGGKSNALESIIYLRSRILRPVYLMKGKIRDEKKEMETVYPEHTFKFDDKCKCLPTYLSILFSIDDKRFFYRLEVDCEGKILKEMLGVDKYEGDNFSILFKREDKEIEILPKLGIPSVEKINQDMPILSYIRCNFDNEIISKVVKWFENICTLDYNNLLREGFFKFFDKDRKKEEFLRLLNAMGIGISDIRLVFTQQGTIEQVYTVRKVGSKRKELRLEEESGGTKKLFSFLPELLVALDRGSIVIADELDAKIHPKLLEKIIQLFTDRNINKHNAQLIMTSHDLVTMNLSIFRRDEIWFAALDDDFCSRLYSLVEFKEDKDADGKENVVRNYLNGRYGADPYFAKMVSLNGENMV